MAGWRFATVALADFREIIHHVEQESGSAMADRLRDDFFGAFDLLAGSPRIGRVKEYTPPGVRGWVVHSYVVFYDAEVEPIRIVRILHGARDLRVVFEHD